MSDQIFRILLLVFVMVQGVSAIVLVTQNRRPTSLLQSLIGQRREGIGLSFLLAVGYFAYSAGIVAYLIRPRWMAWSAWPALPVEFRWLGLGLLLASMLLVLWSLRTLRSNFAFSVSPQEGASLVTNGPYHWVRHPLYTAYLIQGMGIGLMMANGFVSLIAILVWVAVAFRVPLEEEELIERFGDQYREYQTRTGRLVPRWSSALKSRSR